MTSVAEREREGEENERGSDEWRTKRPREDKNLSAFFFFSFFIPLYTQDAPREQRPSIATAAQSAKREH
jgi:hypothetical protein